MTRTSKYLNQDTIAALQSFQIEKIDREITDYLDTNYICLFDYLFISP